MVELDSDAEEEVHRLSVVDLVVRIEVGTSLPGVLLQAATLSLPAVVGAAVVAAEASAEAANGYVEVAAVAAIGVVLARRKVRLPARMRRRHLLPPAGVTLRGMPPSRSGRGCRRRMSGSRARRRATLVRCTPDHSEDVEHVRREEKV